MVEHGTDMKRVDPSVPMTGICVITNLPTALSCSILNEWLVLKEVARLDSAYCNRDSRSKLLGLLRADEFVSNDSLNATFSALVSWIILRDVKVRRVACIIDCFLTNLAEYVKRNEKHIRCLDQHSCCNIGGNFRHLVELTCYLNQPMIEMIRHNPHLQSITIIGGLDDDYCPLLNSITLPKLQTLVFMSGNVFNCPPCVQCVLSMVQMSTNLQELRLNKFHPIPHGQWSALARYCPQLRALHVEYLNITDADIVEFTRLCPRITTLHLSMQDELTDDGILGVVQHLTHLRSLSLSLCGRLTDTSLAHITQHCSGCLEEFRVLSFVMTQDALTALPGRFSTLRVCQLRTHLDYFNNIPELGYWNV